MNILHEISRNNPDSVAFVDAAENCPSLTYGDVSKLIDAIALRLRLQEFCVSERIAVITPRGKDGLLTFLAVSSYAVCCPLDPRLLDGELASALRELEAVAVVDATGDQRIANIASSLAIPIRSLRFVELSLDAPTAPVRRARRARMISRCCCRLPVRRRNRNTSLSLIRTS